MSRRLTTFDGQTLDDATTYHFQQVDETGPVVRNSLLVDVNGNIYDVDGTGNNTTIPGSMTGELVIHADTAAAFNTAAANIAALNGTEGTLTGTLATGGTETCTARCTSVPITTREVNHSSFIQTFRLTFAQKTDWA